MERFWWIQIRALSKSGKWPVMADLAKKRSPIGYAPFVEVCIQYRNWIEAEKYVNLISDLPQKAKLLVKLRKVEEAVNIALQLKDTQLLLEIKSKCPKEQVSIVDRALNQFK